MECNGMVETGGANKWIILAWCSISNDIPKLN